MIANNRMQIVKDLPNKKLHITRFFDAAPAQVWEAWTNRELLDQWWAPKPWRAETRSMEFREGGKWMYAMVGPENTRDWCIVNYISIEPGKSFTGTDGFCDADGNANTDLPTMLWKVDFHPEADGTKVSVEVTFTSEADLEKIIEMGFEAGFTAALENLDALLEA